MPAKKKIASRQIDVLLNFIEDHKDLAKGRVSQQGGRLGKQATCQLWDRLAEKLNCCGSGVTKSAKEWKVYWNNMKYKVRSKATQLRNHMSGTGGGPALTDKLNPTECRLMAVLGNESVFGEESVRIPFPEFEYEVPAASSHEVLNEEESGSFLVIGAEEIRHDASPAPVALSPSPAPVIWASAPQALAPDSAAPAQSAPAPAQAPEVPVPAPEVPVPAPAPSAPAPAAPVPTATATASRPYVRRIPDIPAWARKMEERHIAAQEKTAAALGELLAVQKEMLSVLKARLPM